MTHTRDEIMAMDADALNEAIYRAQGYEKLAWPAVPRWQKPGSALYDEPKYSTFVADAWGLVIAGIDITVHHHIFGNGLWYATIHTGPNTRAIYADGETMCIAICRAWLLWKAAQC